MNYDDKSEPLEDAYQLFVRDSAITDKTNSRLKVFAFILHGPKLLYWMLDEQKPKNYRVGLVHDNIVARRLQIISSHSFEFHTMSDSNKAGEIKKVQVESMTYRTSSLYKEKNIGEQIRSHNYDSMKNKIVLLIRSGNKPPDNVNMDLREFRLKLFDVATSKVQINIIVTNPEIIGILSSGYYTLVDGHIYHNNHVIKMRYDLLEV